MYRNNGKTYIKTDLEAVITSYNQGNMILEAVQSICNQTLLPERIIVVDDGSTDQYSLDILNSIKNDVNLPVPITVYFQENQGVSAARDRKSTRLNSSHSGESRMPSSA